MFGYLGKGAICACLFTAILCPAASVFAQSEEEMDILQMIYKDKDLVTPTRSPKPVSQVAENITVIDAEEIEAINAHTLTDVLFHVTGVQMDILGGPGAVSNPHIQGSDQRHVRVMVDGVTLNNLADNFADIGSFPVQQIERIEIIKGPASSAWGSSLGGIINIITKSPDPDRKFGGSALAAIGERTTGDFRADVSGTMGGLGYYLYGGGFTSDGLTTNTPFDGGNFYGKLQLQATKQIRLQYTQSYTKGARGDGQFDFPGIGLVTAGDKFEYLFSTLSMDYAITDHLELDLAGHLLKQRNKIIRSFLNLGLEEETLSNDTTYGGSAKIAWRRDMLNLLAGFDYDNGTIESNSIENDKQRQEKWAFFANGTLTKWGFSFTPGLRYDHTSTNGNFVSPSLGLTYTLFEKTILRAYVARWFNTPPLGFTFAKGFGNPGLKPEKVWSYSIGVETPISQYLWLKVTGFLHDIGDVIDQNTLLIAGKQRRQGVEAELRTIPVWNTSLMAGYSFIDITDRASGEVVKNLPRHTYDLGVDYNDNDAWRGALRGHWIWWNADADANGKYTAMIWDLNLARKVLEKGDAVVELFFTAHNIFNGAQYSTGVLPNPKRWFEGGLKCKF